jgi:hypothetical protein
VAQVCNWQPLVATGALNALGTSAHAGLAPQVITTAPIVGPLGFLHRKTEQKYLQVGRKSGGRH